MRWSDFESLARLAGRLLHDNTSATKTAAIRTTSQAPTARPAADSMQARNPFMSVVPRPNTRSPARVSANGSRVQGWPSTGTTSVWPESMMPGASRGPRLAKRPALRPVSSAPLKRSKPRAARNSPT